jgi:hypothetical protein
MDLGKAIYTYIYIRIHAYTVCTYIYIHILTYSDISELLLGGDFEVGRPTPLGVWMDSN